MSQAAKPDIDPFHDRAIKKRTKFTKDRRQQDKTGGHCCGSNELFVVHRKPLGLYGETKAVFPTGKASDESRFRLVDEIEASEMSAFIPLPDIDGAGINVRY